MTRPFDDYDRGYHEGRARAEHEYYCPTLFALRQENFTRVEAHAFGKGFFERCKEIDALNAIDRVADFVASIGGCWWLR